MSFGPRNTVTDNYGQDVQVDVDMGDAEVCVQWREPEGHVAISTLSPDDADLVADQLKVAADEARKYGGER